MCCRSRIPASAGVLVLALAVATAQAGDPAAGKRKAQQCMACHGVDGVSRQPDAPNIAGNSELYIETQLRAFRSGKREHQQMNVIADALSDEDVADLAAWYSAIEISVTLPEIDDD